MKPLDADTLAQIAKENPSAGTSETPTDAQVQEGTEVPVVPVQESTATPADTDIEFTMPADTKADSAIAVPAEETVQETTKPTPEVSQEGSEISEPFDPFVIKKITAGGFTVEEVKARMLKDGGISEEYSAELKKTIDPDLVDTYMQSLSEGLAKAGQVNTPVQEPNADLIAKNAVRADLNKFIYDSVGGQEKFTIMSAALKAKLPAEAIDVLNAKLASPSKALIAEGMQEAVKHYRTLTGRTNTRMEGTPTSPEGKPFEFLTKNDYHTVMRSEKYKTDAAFAKETDQRRLTSREMDAKVSLPGQYRMIRDGAMYNL